MTNITVVFTKNASDFKASMIKDLQAAYNAYFATYTPEQIEGKFGIKMDAQAVVKDKLGFLEEESQVEQLAQALLVGTVIPSPLL